MSPCKYTFRRESSDGKIIEVKFEADFLGEIVDEFRYFLNGCSFSYVKDIEWIDYKTYDDDIQDSDDLKRIVNDLHEQWTGKKYQQD